MISACENYIMMPFLTIYLFFFARDDVTLQKKPFSEVL